MAVEGTLEIFKIPEILQMISQQQKTGILHLRAKEQEVQIGFKDGSIVKAELEKSGQRAALIARSGLDLARFGVRYSHAGVTLKGVENNPGIAGQG